MVGDASVIPAVATSLARVPAGVPVHVLLEVEDPADEQPLSSPGELHLQWLPEGTVLDALERLGFPAGAVHAFVHGEASTVRAVRRHLLVDRGVPREALSASGYWKRTRTEEGWREDKAEWNRQAEQDVAAALSGPV
jgi:NADPH-dependent ferric siderophore reductase